MVNEELVLVRDCLATVVPAGDEIMLERGTVVMVSQALGGTVTVRTPFGLFRIAARDLDALGKELPVEEKNDFSNEPFSEEQVWKALKTCFDPEIPINIVDLGLIYNLTITEKSQSKFHVDVNMTLTAQGCGMGPSIAADAKEKIEALPAVQSAAVEIIWDPVWNPQMISEEGRVALGLN